MEKENKELETKPNEETIEAKPVEEVKPSEKTEEAKPEPKPVKYIEPLAEDVSIEKSVEEKRAEFLKLYKKSKLRSNVSTFISLAFIIAAFVLIVQNSQVCKILGYVFAGVTLVGMIVFFFLNKNILPKATKVYIETLSSTYNSYIYGGKPFEKATVDPEGKMTKEEFMADGVYENVTRVGCRNVVHATYKKEQITVADVALHNSEKNKKEVVLFVGKYNSYFNKLKFDGKIIINKRFAKDPTDIPTQVDGMKETTDGDLFIYHDENVNYKKILPESFLKSINNFKGTEHLFNVNIAIWGGKTIVYMSYDDDTMVFPFEHEFKEEPIKSYKFEQEQMLKIISLLN